MPESLLSWFRSGLENDLDAFIEGFGEGQSGYIPVAIAVRFSRQPIKHRRRQLRYSTPQQTELLIHPVPRH